MEQSYFQNCYLSLHPLRNRLQTWFCRISLFCFTYCSIYIVVRLIPERFSFRTVKWWRNISFHLFRPLSQGECISIFGSSMVQGSLRYKTLYFAPNLVQRFWTTAHTVTFEFLNSFDLDELLRACPYFLFSALDCYEWISVVQSITVFPLRNCNWQKVILVCLHCCILFSVLPTCLSPFISDQHFWD